MEGTEEKGGLLNCYDLWRGDKWLWVRKKEKKKNRKRGGVHPRPEGSERHRPGIKLWGGRALKKKKKKKNQNRRGGGGGFSRPGFNPPLRKWDRIQDEPAPV